ncbi:lysis protein [Enterobacter kobei]|jgi:prophage endopeptidase|uniref:Endopeptidase n=2 Tax=Enterobacter kobei TaxID=208224 RepID=A0AA86IR27_9ENTR|nr:lysis protein [Enterobacter kobei]OLR20703.1 lysis protein [Enterobacter kobei]BCU56001.1 endopeptidase [Enterobacter kobei]SIQ33101.1 prophage endopeptidase [Enterobacter kobei]
MIPAFQKGWWKPLAVVLAITLPLMAALHFYGKSLAEQERAETAEHSLKLAKDTIADMQVRQRDVAALDAKYTGELQDAKATIDQLGRDVASGKRRLQVNARCTANGQASTGSMGDATTPKLTGDAERDYWRLRDGIETITGQVKYLQDYIKSQCVN